MALHALQDVGDAVDATRELFTPVDRSLWLRLALIAFFVGGGSGAGSLGNVGSSVPDAGTGGGPPSGELPSVPAEVLVLGAAVVVVLLAVGLAFAAVAAVMEFAFVESLRSREAHVRRYVRRYWRRGLRLLGFRVGVGLVALATVAVPAAAVFLLGPPDPVTLVLAALVAVPLFLLVGLAFGLVNGFTTVFVVPIMLAEDRGVLSAWGRLWPAIRAEWQEFLAYAVVGFVLSVAVGLAVGTLVAAGALLLLIPFGTVGGIALVLAGVGGGFSPVALAVLGLLAVAYVLVLLVVVAVVRAPFQSFLRYYALFVLGDVAPEFDVIPEVRSSVRSEPETGAERGAA